MKKKIDNLDRFLKTITFNNWMVLQVNILPKYKIFTHMTWFFLFLFLSCTLFSDTNTWPYSICFRIFNWAHCLFGPFFFCMYSYSWSLLITWVYLFRDPCTVNSSVRKFIESSFESKQIPLESINNNNNNVKYHAVKLKRTFSYSTYIELFF